MPSDEKSLSPSSSPAAECDWRQEESSSCTKSISSDNVSCEGGRSPSTTSDGSPCSSSSSSGSSSPVNRRLYGGGLNLGFYSSPSIEPLPTTSEADQHQFDQGEEPDKIFSPSSSGSYERPSPPQHSSEELSSSSTTASEDTVVTVVNVTPPETSSRRRRIRTNPLVCSPRLAFHLHFLVVLPLALIYNLVFVYLYQCADR